mmetsp:Transcript_55580/g.159869  ORF Transcript_55580/g.159869 Transcript_55580/m.159869 type:complete len:352 (+) Transcript_55580:609-1664(+)
MVPVLGQLSLETPLAHPAVQLVEDMLSLAKLLQDALVISQRCFLHQQFLLPLQLRQLLVNVRIHKVVDVLAIHNLRHDIVLPRRILEDRPLPKVHGVDAGTSELLHPIPLELLLLAIFHVSVGLARLCPRNALWDVWRPVRRRGPAGNVQPASQGVRLALLHLLLHPSAQQQVAALVSGRVDTLARRAGGLEEVHRLLSTLFHGVQQRALLGRQLRHLSDVCLVQDNEQRPIPEERLDGVEQSHLHRNGVAAHLRDIDKEKNGRGQVRQGGDGRHLDRVPVLEGVVEDTRGVDDLPPDVVVIQMTHEERLRCECVRLHVHVGLCDDVHEGRLAYIRVARQDQCPCRRIDGR